MLNVPDGEAALWTEDELLTSAHASVKLAEAEAEVDVTETEVTEVVFDGAAVTEGPEEEVLVAAIQLHALDSLTERGPFWFCLQASTAYEGMAVAATLPAVKVAQNSRAAPRRPGT